MIFDRRPFYLVGAAVGLLVFGFFLFAPHTTADQKVQEQLAILSREPWIPVQVVQVEVQGAAKDPDQVLLHGVRQDGSKVLIHFVAKSPYTAPTAMHRLVEQPLEGRRAEVLMLPRSLVLPPFQAAFQPTATHAGVALFAGFPDHPMTAATETPGQASPTPAPASAPGSDG